MARRTKRLWTDEEKRSICFQTVAPGVSVAQVARRYAMNANMVFKWLHDPRYAPEADSLIEASAADVACFLPVEIVDHPRKGGTHPATDPMPADLPKTSAACPDTTTSSAQSAIQAMPNMKN